jgi:hypothetical protein
VLDPAVSDLRWSPTADEGGGIDVVGEQDERAAPRDDATKDLLVLDQRPLPCPGLQSKDIEGGSLRPNISS